MMNTDNAGPDMITPLAATKPSHFDMYMNESRLLLQKERKRDELQRLRTDLRGDKLNKFRNGPSVSVEESDYDQKFMDCSVENEETGAIVPVNDFNEILTNLHSGNSSYIDTKLFANKLMETEWLLEIPNDFQTDYKFKLCPKGRHSFLVCYRGHMVILSRSGTVLCGPYNCLSKIDRKVATLLDGIFNSWSKTFYILDVIAWRGNLQTDQSAVNRFAWLKHFVLQDLQLNCFGQHSIQLVVMPSFDADFTTMRYVFEKECVGFEVDGILFYHCASVYVSGITALVNWLKPYMMQDMFNLPYIHPSFLREEAPGEYMTVKEKIQAWNQKNPYWRSRRTMVYDDKR